MPAVTSGLRYHGKAAVSSSDFRVTSHGIVVRNVSSFRMTTAIVFAVSAVVPLAISLVLRPYLPQAVTGWLWFGSIFVALASGATLASSSLFHDPTLATARSRGRPGSIAISGESIVVETGRVTRRYPMS